MINVSKYLQNTTTIHKERKTSLVTMMRMAFAKSIQPFKSNLTYLKSRGSGSFGIAKDKSSSFFGEETKQTEINRAVFTSCFLLI